MGSLKQEEAGAIKLPLLSIQLPVSHDLYSPEHSGMLTPPLHASVSVPFRWEEEPGKPRPCTALITRTLSHLQDPHTTDNTTTTPTPIKCLELPPRLQSFNDPKIMSSSPTTVLDGPYLPLFQSSSFRFTSRRRERQGSFGSSCESPERGQFGSNSSTVGTALSNKSGSSTNFFDEGKGRSSGGLFFGSWRRKSSHTHKRGKSEVGGGSFVAFSPFSVDLGAGFGVDDHERSGGPGGGGGGGGDAKKVKKVSRIARNGSFSSLSQVRSHFWATIYKGFKQVLPRKSTNAKKDVLLI